MEIDDKHEQKEYSTKQFENEAAQNAKEQEEMAHRTSELKAKKDREEAERQHQIREAEEKEQKEK